MSPTRPRTLLRALILCLAALCLGPAGAALAQGGSPPPPPGTAPPAPVDTPDEQVLYEDGHGGRRLLDGTWLFRLDPQDRGLAEGFKDQVSQDGWGQVQVPHAWNATDISDESQRGTVGWYRKDFRLPRTRRGTAWRFRFESVNYRATVFLNGTEIGRHEAAYIPFEIPAERLSRTGVNRLVIRVDNRRAADSLPSGRNQINGRPGGGWWNFGGLLREVYLREVDQLDIEELLVRPTLPCRACDAKVLVRAKIANPGGGAKRARLVASVGDARPKFPEVVVPSGGSREVSATFRLEDPRLWEPGNPELYSASAVVRVVKPPKKGKKKARSSATGGTTYRTKFGVRSLKVRKDGRMLLNGQPVTLRGASLHEDHPDVGAALTPEDRREDFELLTGLGGTILRAHYPLHPHFLEMADRAGVLVWDQIPFYQIRNEFLRKRAVRQKGLDYLEDTILRDQNHPSVFVWSIANELGSRPSSGQQRYIDDAVKLIRKKDPTRLSAIDFAGYPTVPPLETYRKLDAVGVNNYFGWYPGPNGQIVDRDLLGPYLDQVHEYYPDQAIFVTEFGAESNRGGPIDEKGTFAFQREFMQFHLSTYDSRPFINGAVTWILRDFKVRPDWDGGNPKPTPPYNEKGLVDESGKTKPAYDETRRLFRDVEPLQATRAR